MKRAQRLPQLLGQVFVRHDAVHCCFSTFALLFFQHSVLQHFGRDLGTSTRITERTRRLHKGVHALSRLSHSPEGRQEMQAIPRSPESVDGSCYVMLAFCDIILELLATVQHNDPIHN